MWRELKKINPSRCNIPTTVDDACNAPDIAELFMSKYETLYNSVPTSDDELDDITRLINNGVVNESYDNIKFSVDVITKCIRRIKSGKSDGNMGFDSDHLLNGTSKLCYMISVLFNVMIMHGHSAQDLLYSTIVSIPKNKRASLCCSDNYRGIALCCSICKVLDMAILDQFRKYLYTSDLQFGFKPGLSTTLCTAMYIETVDYYVNRNSDVFSCLLDASKAFDKVHYGKLFNLLIKRKLPFLIVRLLLDSYTRQEVCVSWDSCKSRYFNVKNGVKQGGVLSPILFIVYFDELIELLRRSHLGCHIGTHYVGALGYADDLTLISPSLRALNKMLFICQSFATEYNVSFNVNKTMCIKFGSPVRTEDKLYLNDSLINWVDQVKHLGNIVSSNLRDNSDCSLKRSIFNGSVNKLFGSYGGLQRPVLCKLFKSYCCAFYGSQLWTLDSNGFRSCCVQWNKAVRKVLRLPYRTHTWLLGPLMDQCHISIQLYVKSLRFIYSMINSENDTVAFVGSLVRHNANSPIGRNVSFLKHNFNINLNETMFTNVALIFNAQPLCVERQSQFDNLINLMYVRNDELSLDGFENDMVDTMIDSILTD